MSRHTCLASLAWPSARATELGRALAAAGAGPRRAVRVQLRCRSPLAPSPTPSGAIGSYVPPADRAADLAAPIPPASGHAERAASPLSPRQRASSSLDDSITALAGAAGLLAEPTDLPAASLACRLRRRPPLLIGLQDGAAPRLLAILGAGRRTLRVLAPNGSIVHMSAAAVARTLTGALVEPIDAAIAELAATAAIPRRARRRFDSALQRHLLARSTIGPCWSLRPAPATPFRRQLARSGVMRSAVHLVIARALHHLFTLAAWWLLVRSVLDQRMEPALAGAWLLALLGTIPCRMLELSASIAVATRFAYHLRRWVAGTVLRTGPDLTGRGIGSLFARTLDLEALETRLLSGGPKALAALLELAVAISLLLAGGTGGAVLLLVGFLALAVLLFARYLSACRAAAADRDAHSASLTESLLGHRTRLVQLPPDLWLTEEEPRLLAYLDSCRRADRRAACLAAGLSRSWLLLGLAALSVAAAARAAPARLAAALAGVVVAASALAALTSALFDLAGASVAWRGITPLLGRLLPANSTVTQRVWAFLDPALRSTQAGRVDARERAARGNSAPAHRDPPEDHPFPRSASASAEASRCTRHGAAPWCSGAPSALSSASASATTSLRSRRESVHSRSSSAESPLPAAACHAKPLITARGVAFRQAGGRLALAPLNLTLRPGDRLLVTGPSGSGKTTLGALLAGLRVPTSGLLLLRGLDLHAWGAEGWQAAAARAPQCDDNHLFSQTLAFNLLLGCRWPAAPVDLARAEGLCRELGLGDLLDRMPAGLGQPIGDAAWQLSQGEQSRVYLARALLQQRELTILDESFGAFDPETASSVLPTVLAHARTLAALAHP